MWIWLVVFFVGRFWEAIAASWQGWWTPWRGREVKAGYIFIFLLPPNLFSSQHVFCNAPHRLVNFGGRERQTGWCWLAIGLGSYCNQLGNCCFVHLVSGCAHLIPWQGILIHPKSWTYLLYILCLLIRLTGY